jgi:hypothetical protein
MHSRKPVRDCVAMWQSFLFFRIGDLPLLQAQ